jgi:hypothetical protein
MPHEFDPGYGMEPFRTLCAHYPGESVYPSSDFRIEWGPIFHRGRLDGTARLLVIGQDPAAQESVARRILVGTAGHRLQGFLAKLGLSRSYAMVNTFLYSVYGQGGGEKHAGDTKIAAYRHQWLDALLVGTQVTAVVALGHLADEAWTRYRKTAQGKTVQVIYRHVTHPTQPDSASKGSATKRAQLMATMLQNWNAALDALRPAITAPDVPIPATHYGNDFTAAELVEIPEADLPPGTPPWMRASEGWARRTGTGAAKRRTIEITIPA